MGAPRLNMKSLVLTCFVSEIDKLAQILKQVGAKPE
jgi:hypothetical protein